MRLDDYLGNRHAEAGVARAGARPVPGRSACKAGSGWKMTSTISRVCGRRAGTDPRSGAVPGCGPSAALFLAPAKIYFFVSQSAAITAAMTEITPQTT